MNNKLILILLAAAGLYVAGCSNLPAPPSPPPAPLGLPTPPAPPKP